jgi:hypothetical protein
VLYPNNLLPGDWVRYIGRSLIVDDRDMPIVEQGGVYQYVGTGPRHERGAASIIHHPELSRVDIWFTFPNLELEFVGPGDGLDPDVAAMYEHLEEDVRRQDAVEDEVAVVEGITLHFKKEYIPIERLSDLWPDLPAPSYK